MYKYSETDDKQATRYLTLLQVVDLIDEHNKYFNTNYNTITEFNNGEEYRSIITK